MVAHTAGAVQAYKYLKLVTTATYRAMTLDSNLKNTNSVNATSDAIHSDTYKPH